MRLLAIIFTALILSSCLDSDSSPEELDENEQTPPPPVELREINMNASRDYNPSSWHHHDKISQQSGDFLAPESLPVLAGLPGTGWASLYIGERKFCYQGDGSSNSAGDGTQFILVKEKAQLSPPCHSAGQDIEFNREVEIQKDMELRLEVNGGGCSSSQNTCVYTEVQAIISPNQ